jgi:hypothetical protein
VACDEREHEREHREQHAVEDVAAERDRLAAGVQTALELPGGEPGQRDTGSQDAEFLERLDGGEPADQILEFGPGIAVEHRNLQFGQHAQVRGHAARQRIERIAALEAGDDAALRVPIGGRLDALRDPL